MKIVCIGSSSVEGIGDEKGVGWVGRLNEYLVSKAFFSGQYRVFNLGLKGDTVADTIKRYHSEALVRKPHLVIIFTGTNDVRKDVINGIEMNTDSKDSCLKEWESFLKELKRAGHDTLVLGPTRVDESKEEMIIHKDYQIRFYNKDISKYNNSLKKLCKDYGVDFLELFTLFDNDNIQSFSADCVHPNSKGYDLIFKNIVKHLDRGSLKGIR